MTTTKILAASVFATLLFGCSNQGTPAPAPAPAPQPQTFKTEGAARIHGDVVPSRLVAIALPAVPNEPVLSNSSPGQPKKPILLQQVAESSTRREFARVLTTADAATGSISIPIDAPSGARVILTSRDPNGSIRTAHLLDAAGTILDRSRDENSKIVVGQPAHLDEGLMALKKADALKGLPPLPTATTGSSTTSLDSTLTTASPGAQELIKAGFGALALPRRILSIDTPTKAGRITIDVPASVLAKGLEIDVQQPNSGITFTGVSRELNYGFGDEAQVEYVLANGDKPIDGATLTGQLELPNGERIKGMTFTSEGNGKYLGHVPLAAADLKYIGVWHVRAKATGSVDGVEFERDMDNGFAYSPAHARMLAVHSPEIVRAADGLIDEIKLDIDVESLSADRLGVGGLLAFKTPDGVEHSVAIAETSANVAVGTSTMTLHFEAKDLALSNVDGPFLVRDVFLMSHSFSTLQHRLGRGLDIVTPTLAATELRYPTSFSPAVEEMFDLGELDRR